MTGRINYSPEAEKQLLEPDDWVAKASAEIARRFVSVILDRIDGILVFPLAGRARDGVRPGMRTSTFKKKTLVAYEVNESSDEIVVNILGVFHGRPGLGGRAPRRSGRSGGGQVMRSCVANAWQEDRRLPFAANTRQCVCAGQPQKPPTTIDSR